MTPDELRVLHFALHALAYAVGFVLLVVLPWAASGRSLRIPAVEVGRWEPRRGSGKRGSEGKGKRSRSGHGQSEGRRTGKSPGIPLQRSDAPCPVPDRDADDAIAACHVLGFTKRESEECVRELRGRMPGVGCGELVKAAISKLGKGCA